MSRVSELLRENNLVFNRAMVLSGLTKTNAVAAEVTNSLDLPAGSHVCVSANTWEDVNDIQRHIIEQRSDALIAVGGGKILDVAKIASAQQRIPLVAMPTTLSSDGIASPIAVVTGAAGQYDSVGAQSPTALLVDLDLVRSAPLETLQAGVGDLLSNLSAIEDWRLAAEVDGERIDGFALLVARHAAEAFLGLTMRTAQATVDLRGQDFVVHLAEGLLMSGLAMSICGTSRPCSGAEHLISHALDRVLAQRRPHGLQVGAATIFVNRLRGADTTLIEAAMRRLGVPTSMRELGIELSEFIEALRIAPHVRPGRLTILDSFELSVLERVAAESYVEPVAIS